MMPRTLAAGLLALLLWLVALSIPEPPVETHRVIPLDLSGIEEVEVVAPAEVSITLTAKSGPGITHEVEEGQGVTHSRDGTRLRITSDVVGYQGVLITLPADLRRLVVRNAAVATDGNLDDLRIEVEGSLSWEGDVARLQVIHTGAPPGPPPAEVLADPDYAPCGRECQDQLRINAGAINRLEVTTGHAHVTLGKSDNIDDVRLRLGEDASFALVDASRLDNIHLEPTAAPPVATDPGKPEP